MNKAVAISDEFINRDRQRKEKANLMFDRRVTRIITPGTLIDERFVDPMENNYLLSIYLEPAESGSSDSKNIELSTEKHARFSDNIGLAWLDLSSGDFFIQSSRPNDIASHVALIKPSEILVDSQLENLEKHPLDMFLGEYDHMISYQELPENMKPLSAWNHMIEPHPMDNDRANFPEVEICAATFLLEYVAKQLRGLETKLQYPRRRDETEEMAIDQNSLRALEIRTTLKDGKFTGSLLHSVRKTSTKSGTRLLTQRLSRLQSKLVGVKPLK